MVIVSDVLGGGLEVARTSLLIEIPLRRRFCCLGGGFLPAGRFDMWEKAEVWDPVRSANSVERGKAEAFFIMLTLQRSTFSG